MLTLRFESDSLGSGPALTFLTEAPYFRVRKTEGGTTDVLIDLGNGCEAAHQIGEGPGNYHRCYVMNSAGKTVASF